MHQESMQINSFATFVGDIKNIATQDSTYEKWVLSRPGQAEYVAALKEVTECTNALKIQGNALGYLK